MSEMLYNIDDFQEVDRGLLVVYNNFYLNDKLPENSDMDKFEISFFDDKYEDDFEELIPFATDLIEVLLEGHTVFNTFCGRNEQKTLTSKQKELKRKLIRQLPDGYTENLFGEYYKTFLKIHNLPCDKVFADKLDVSSITDGADIRLIKTYFSFIDNLGYVFPELYGYRDLNLFLSFKDKEEILRFTDFMKPDIFVSFTNWHTVFSVTFKKDSYSKRELISKVLTVCEKHGKKLIKGENFDFG